MLHTCLTMILHYESTWQSQSLNQKAVSGLVGVYIVLRSYLTLGTGRNRIDHCIYKLQPYRTRTPRYEFCMGGQIRIDNLPHKSFITVLSCMYQGIVTSGILAMEFGEHLSSEKESECFGGRAQVYTETPRSSFYRYHERVL